MILEITKERAINVKLYPIYKMLSWDLLFYYSIIFLFLTQVKGISASDVLLADSFYVIFRLILLIPLTALIEKIGKRRSIIFANISLCISILTFILSQNFTFIIIANLFQALGFVIKNMAESNLLYDSLPQNNKRGDIFSRIEGRGSALYYFTNALSLIISGFLYVYNAYLPLILCLIMCILSVIISFKFHDVIKIDNEEEITVKEYVKNLEYSFKNLFKSSRLRNLIFFGATFSSLLYLLVTIRSGLLTELNIPEQYFGIIFGVLDIVAGLTAREQYVIHKRFRNRSLTVLSLPVSISCLLIGVAIFCKLPFYFIISIILLMFLIQYICKAPFYNLIKQYLNNFTNASIRNKISASYNLMESTFRALLSFIVSLLLNITTISIAFVYIGGIFTLIFIVFLEHMKTKVGLSPDKYSKKDIEFLELK